MAKFALVTNIVAKIKLLCASSGHSEYVRTPQSEVLVQRLQSLAAKLGCFWLALCVRARFVNVCMWRGLHWRGLVRIRDSLEPRLR